MSQPKRGKARKPKKASEDEFDVELIRAFRTNSATGDQHCLIKWVDFDESHTGWEKLENVHADEHLANIKKHLSQPSPQWKWEYYLTEYMDGMAPGWHAYDSSAGASMDRFFKQYCDDQSQMMGVIECVHSGSFHYEVDFEAMKQKNVKTGKVRSIRCLPVFV